MSKEQAKKERLFDLYAANLSACRPEYQNLFACPLCLDLFEKSAVAEKQVTLEHIIPSGRGAANETLSCQKGNNTTGSRTDADLLKRIDFEERCERNGGPVHCEIVTGEGRHKAQLYVRRGEAPLIEIIGLPKQSNPRLLQKAVEEFRVVENFTLNWNADYVHVRSQTAMLRSAYLTMFRYYGYSYILNPSLNCVREQIEQPIVKGEDGQSKIRHATVLRGILTIPQPCARTRVTLVTGPASLRSFIVHLGLSQELPYSYGVVLPGPEYGAEVVYERLKPQVRFDFSVLDYSSVIIADPSHAHAVQWLWHSVGKEKSNLPAAS